MTTIDIDPRTGVHSWAEWRGRSHCMRCRTAWGAVQGHSTNYSGRNGTFPLCKQCWSELTPISRLPFYQVLWAQHLFEVRHRPKDVDELFLTWTYLEAAVRAGK